MPWVCPAFVIVYVGVFGWDELVPKPDKNYCWNQEKLHNLKNDKLQQFFLFNSIQTNKMHSNLRKRESLPVNASFQSWKWFATRDASTDEWIPSWSEHNVFRLPENLHQSGQIRISRAGIKYSQSHPSLCHGEKDTWEISRLGKGFLMIRQLLIYQSDISVSIKLVSVITYWEWV